MINDHKGIKKHKRTSTNDKHFLQRQSHHAITVHKSLTAIRPLAAQLTEYEATYEQLLVLLFVLEHADILDALVSDDGHVAALRVAALQLLCARLGT